MEEILASIRRIISDDARPDADGHHEPDHAAPPPPDAEARHHAPLAAEDEFVPPALLSSGPVDGADTIEPVSAPVAEQAHDKPPESTLGHAPQEGAMPEPTPALLRHPLAPLDDAGHAEPAARDSAVRDHGEHDPVSREHILDDYVPTSAAAPEPLFSAAVDSSVTAAFNTLAASRLVDNSEHLTGLVREMIRPLVKDWVEANLPGMVERIVVAEIERMARGGR